MTISGPPSVLNNFLDSNALKAHYFSIETPYHSSVLYGVDDVEDVLGSLRDKTLEVYRAKIPLLSPVSGRLVAAADFTALLRQAVADTLCEQVRLDKILLSCAELLSHRMSSGRCMIWPVASNAATLMASTLSGVPEVSVSTYDSLNSAVEGAQPEMPSGKFQDSKIAVVGFSGRFPEAASNEGFWELLRAGQDTHRTVPKDRFDWEAHFDPTGKKKNTSRVKYGCFINQPVSITIMFSERFSPG